MVSNRPGQHYKETGMLGKQWDFLKGFELGNVAKYI